MCNFGDFEVNEHVNLTTNGEPYPFCNKCGAVPPQEWNGIGATYLGHAEFDNFGLSDVFEYDEPMTCPNCGQEITMWQVPCDGILEKV